MLSRKVFSAASSGMEIKFVGKSSHAAEPENGTNPGYAMAQMISALYDMLKINNFFEEFALITPVHLKLGEIAYGTSPGEGVMHLTLRSYLEKDMQLMKKELESLVRTISLRENLIFDIKYEEEFPSTENHPDAIQLLEKAVHMGKFESAYMHEPFRWSEDFGHFTSRFQGAMFGIGSGEKQPALHNPDFDFPDEMIITGISIYMNICRQVLNSSNENNIRY
jgi:metal-dependent amidase/aminoacylase/carboxypeptidase family protein